MAQTSNSALAWATDEASAALTMGMSVPEIEKRLVAKGLTPAMATTVVMDIIKGRLAGQRQSSEQVERNQVLHRSCSAVAMCVCVLLGYLYGEGYSAGKAFSKAALPVACIWFPWGEEFPILIRWCAWVVLMLVIVYRLVLLTL